MKPTFPTLPTAPAAINTISISFNNLSSMSPVFVLDVLVSTPQKAGEKGLELIDLARSINRVPFAPR